MNLPGLLLTRSEAYDLACEYIESPAVIEWGDRCIIGRWISIEHNIGGLILKTETKGVEVLGDGNSWDEAALKAKSNFYLPKVVPGKFPKSNGKRPRLIDANNGNYERMASLEEQEEFKQNGYVMVSKFGMKAQKYIIKYE